MRHFKRSSHKLLAAFLAIVMLLSSFNATVFAANAAISPAQELETLSDGTFAVEGELAQNLNPSDIRFNNLEWTGEQITASVNSGRQSQVYEVNRVTPHATLMPYESAEKAIIGARDFAWEQSGYYMPLTEEQDLDPLTSRWQFAMVDTLTHDLKKANETKDPWNPTENIVDFYKTDYNAENWPGIAVPTNWQLQGVGRDGKPYVGYYDPEYGYDAPYFSDPQMPDKVNVKGTVRTIFTSNQSIPLAPADYDPVGFYRRSFDVPAQWISEKNKVFISFGGVEAAYYVYLNGYEVGYHEDSKTPGEFDLTPFLTGDGKNNLLAVKVIRYADSTWIEDQDYINLSGIFRDVYLMATPALHMQDYKVETDFDTAFRDAALKLQVQVNNYTAAMHPENYAVGVQLFDADGKDTGKGMVLPLGTVHANGSVNVNGQMQVEAPHKWFPDDPYLYTLVLSLYDRETGVAVEHISQQLGFREITYRQQDNDNEYDIIRINGQKILMMGVNTHTTSPDGGHYMSKALMEQDMKTIKQSNMNAIRTAHYPPCTYTLYLADRYGVMVILEANNESHGDWQYGANTSVSEENFYAAANSRVQNIVQEEKNRTSVVMWSLGNESGAQNNWANIMENVHKVDHTRPVHYEGFHSGAWGVNRSPDVHSSMYSSPSAYAANCDDDRSWAPSTLLCEFNHAIGNGLGMLSDYTDVFRSKKNAMGGLIWDFDDMAIWTKPTATIGYREDGPNGYLGTSENMAFTEAAEQKNTRKLLAPGSYIEYPNHAGTDGQDIFNEKISGRNPFTLEVWAAPTAGNNDAALIAKGDTQFALKNEVDGANNNIQFSFYTNNRWRSVRVKQPDDYLNGELHHIVGTFDGNVARLYYDGAEVGSYTFAAGETIQTNSYPFAVGRSADRADRNSVSYIAGARVYSRALSAEEITDPNRQPEDDCPAEEKDVVFWTNFSKNHVENGPYALSGTEGHITFAEPEEKEEQEAEEQEEEARILTPGSYIVYQNTAGTNGQDIFNEKISGTQPFSVEVWAAPTSGSNDAVFVAKGDTHFSLKNESDGNLQFSFYTNNRWRSARMKQPDDYLNGELHHIVGTFDGSVARIYYDGVEMGSYTFAAGEGIQANSYPFAVGSSTDRSDRNSVANIAGARIFTRALTPEEIADPDRKPQDDCPEDSDDVLFWTNFKNENVETGPYGLVGSTDHMQFAALSEKEPEQASRSYGRCLAAGSYMVFEDVTNVFNNKISGNQPFSVEVWASPYTSLNDCGYVAKGDHHFALKNEPDGNMQFSLYTNHGWRSARCKQPDDYLDGTLHHIVGTFDGTTAKIYYDGEELGSYTFPSGEYLMTSNSAFAIGKDVENSGRESSADIAAVRIYTRALRSEEATDETRQPTDACPADDPDILLWADFSRDNMEEQAVDMWDFYGNGLYMGYGGDWGEFTNDSYQAANGIISPNRTIQPELANAKKLFQHLNFSAEPSELAQGTIHVRNEYYATNGNAFTYRWFLQENGKVIDSGTLENVPDMPAANNGMDIFADLPTVAIHVPYQLPEALRAGAEYFLTIQACLPEATDWAEAGFIVAQEQFPLSTETAHAARKLADGKLTLTESEEAITVCGENFSVALDKADGVLRDYTVNGTVLLAEGPTPEFSRHKSGGDRGDVTSSVWNNIDSKLKAPAITVERGDQDSFVTLNVKYPTAVSSETFITMTYRISADGVIGGTIALETDVEADAANNTMYRFGVDMVMPEGYEQIDWLTRGPEDNYLDRKDGTFIGQYQTTVTDNFYVYVHSQNSGAHQDTRWMALRNPDNTTGLMFVATDGVMEANAVHFDWTDLNEDHPHKLHPRQETVVSLSGESRGVGGNLAGILPHYRVLSGNKTFKYTLVPFAAAEEDLQTIADPYRTTLPTEDTCPSKNFTDVPAEDHWAHAGIDYCIANGYMSGMSETTFVPAGIVTRAQLVTILYRIAGEPAVEFKGTFEDVAESQFYSAAVEWAAANGIVNGVSETAFDPEGSITREQVAAILYRYSGCPAVEGTLAYRDAFRVSGYAKNAMLWAVNEGIINGVADPHKPTMLEPYAVATRDQIASIIMRFLEK